MKKYITQLGVITLLILLFLGASSISALAQHAHPQKDTYKKPELWSKIEKSPHEKALWTAYMGKSWEELSYTERLKVKMWIQDIWLEQLSNENALIAVIKDKNETVEQKDELIQTIVEEVKTETVEQKDELVQTIVEEVKTETVEQKDELVQTIAEEVKTETIEQKDEIAQTIAEEVKTETVEQKDELVQTIAEEVKTETIEQKDELVQTIVEEIKTETVEQKDEIALFLTTEKLTRKSLVFEVAERDTVYRKVLEKSKVRVFIKDLTEVVLAEPMDMLELKEDLFGNFLIIEDYYNESFKEYEIVYVYYAQKYPLGGFSEARWVSRHDQQLKALKAKRLNILKRKFLDKQLIVSTN